MAIPLGDRPGAGRVSTVIVPTIAGLSAPSGGMLRVALGDGIAVNMRVAVLGGAAVGGAPVRVGAEVALASLVGDGICGEGAGVGVLTHPAKRVSARESRKAVGTRHKAMAHPLP